MNPYDSAAVNDMDRPQPRDSASQLCSRCEGAPRNRRRLGAAVQCLRREYLDADAFAARVQCLPSTQDSCEGTTIQLDNWKDFSQLSVIQCERGVYRTNQISKLRRVDSFARMECAKKARKAAFSDNHNESLEWPYEMLCGSLTIEAVSDCRRCNLQQTNEETIADPTKICMP